MYFFGHNNVNGIIIGSGGRWLVFLATPCGLRQAGGIFPSQRAARAALGAR
ncbi:MULTISPECIES: hypothetical protein [Xanthobacter]|uniref:hypothetical protein n=1 Tax=Xanthobacter TaxID=279 RepID=UPI0037266C87